MRFKYLIITLLLCSLSFAQNKGAVSGLITDKDLNNEAMPFVSVTIKGTTTGTSTDADGKYSISINPGNYTLVISFVGYESVEIPFKINENENIIINRAIGSGSVKLEDIIVASARRQNTEAAVIKEIKLAGQVVSGLSAEQIALSPDRDASQVVRRVPGITISDNNFVQIRGLGSRYNPVMLHNAFAPSVEPDVKSFAFDIIPSSQLDKLLVFKSPSADISGEFAGGLVKVFTKSIPTENQLIYEYSTQYRNGTSLEDFRSQERGSGHWTGFNNGYYDLPGNFPGNLRSSSLTNDQLQSAARSLRNVWKPEGRTAGLDQRMSLSGAYKFKIGENVRIGNVTAVSYSNTYSTFNIRRADYNQYDPVSGINSVVFNYNDTQYTNSIRTGIIHNWAAKINENHTIEFKNLYNQNSVSQYVDRYGKNIEAQQFADLAFGSYDQVYRGIYSGQLTGKHDLGEKTKIDWVLGYNKSNRDQPDYKRYRMDVDPDTKESTIYIPTGQAVSDFLGRFYSEMEEDGKTAGLNISRKLTFKNKPGFQPEVKAGFFYEDKQRTFNARNIGYVRPTENFDDSLLGLTIWELFEPQNINYQGGIRIDEQSNPSDNYSAGNKLFAYYGMATIPFTSKLTGIFGVRVEDNTQELHSFSFTNDPINVSYPITRVLPSVNISYNFTEKTLVRIAYGETLNRPEFRELAPFSFYDFNTNFTNRGNPNLKTPRIHNLDLRYEYYPSSSETISIAGFYKYFKDPIETVFIPGAGSLGAKAFTFGNAQEADNYGVEVEVKKSLKDFTGSKFINDISLLFNASLIKSKVNLGDLAVGQSQNRPLQGQAPYVINSGIFYNNKKLSLQVNLLYNVVGKNIIFVGFDEYPDIYTMPRHNIDMTVYKDITPKLKLKLGVTDLLNQENLLLQDGNEDGNFDRKKDNIIQRFKPGSLFSFGLNYRIF